MNILFLCTGNSCRSQIAEGWVHQMAGDHFEVQSAGIESHGKNPGAIAIMQEIGIDISRQESTVVTSEMIGKADVIVTVCGHADEHCPAVPSSAEKLHWPLSDPAKASGTEEEIMNEFRRTRDDIKARVKRLLDELKEGVSK